MRNFIAVLSFILVMGCSDADQKAVGAWGSKHKITVYSGGVVVRVFHSTGKIENEAHSDGYYFEDASTKKLVTVSGNVVIEQE